MTIADRLHQRLTRSADPQGRVPFQTAKLIGAVTIGPDATADALTALLLTHRLVLRDASGTVADIDQHPTVPLYVHTR
jgi:hypothetical protein